MNNYIDYIKTFNANFKAAEKLELGVAKPLPAINLSEDAPKALIFAPHPDDECIQGGIANRLFRESGVQIINVPVTYGSNVERKMPRKEELENCLNYLGWDMLPVSETGYRDISPKGKAADIENWNNSVAGIKAILEQQQPDLIVFPHEKDWNGTHIGVNHLVMEALALLPSDFSCKVILTEYWGQIYQPNLMIELTEDQVEALVVATTFHVEEVRRNPYHLTLPAYFTDAVRRGGEVVGGQGGAVPDFAFADLYQIREWKDGALEELFPTGLVIAADQDPWTAING